MTSALDRDARVRDALYQARILTNRTPHFSPATRREANRAIDTLERQLPMNRINVEEAARAIDLLNRAHASIAFGLIREPAFAERFSIALRRLGLRGLTSRLDEVPSSVMAQPISGPTGGRLHRDELPPEERVDADGNPLPPPPGFY
jgi:DNA-binding MurR/RpiR family transcriptional regulator